jgi:hypothetical protein
MTDERKRNYFGLSGFIVCSGIAYIENRCMFTKMQFKTELSIMAKNTKWIGKEKAFFYFLLLLLASCRPSYKMYEETYKNTFPQKTDRVPDYSNLNHWAAHPWKKDPSDSIPRPLRAKDRDSSADVFFIHPTTFTQESLRGVEWNASVEDAAVNLKTDYTSALYQASVFNASCRVFMPRYRQAHIYSFFASDTAAGNKALALAYEDVRSAFLYYMKHFNGGRPVIIAGHSQGTWHARMLLKEFFEGQPLQKQLVCAYLPGMVIPANYFTTLPPCTDSTGTGCFTTWRTFRKNYLPPYVEKEGGNARATNPLSWTTDTSWYARRLNKGAVLYNFNKLLPRTNGAKIHQGVLWIERPRFPFSWLSGMKNFHPGDINLFYMNLRENIDQRIRHWNMQQ